MREEFLDLAACPPLADLRRMLRRREDLVRERLRHVHVEVPRQVGEMPFVVEELEAGDDRHGDPGLPAPPLEIEERRVVEEHLGHDVVRPGIHLVFQALDVGLQIGRLEVLLGIGSHADAHVDRRAAVQVFQVPPRAQVPELTHQVDRVTVARAVRSGRQRVHRRVPAHRQHVLDAEVVQFDDRVLGLFLGEAVAEEVRDGVDAPPGLDDPADAERARPLLAHPPHDAPVRLLLEGRFRRMAGDVDERRRDGRDLLHHLHDVQHRPPRSGGMISKLNRVLVARSRCSVTRMVDSPRLPYHPASLALAPAQLAGAGARCRQPWYILTDDVAPRISCILARPVSGGPRG